jgi:hypothetical protein
MKPESQMWTEYASLLGKMLNFNGKVIGKLLTGYTDQINLFFIEKEGVLTPYIESHILSAEEVETRGKSIIKKLQREYVKCAVEKLQKGILMSGQSATMICETEKNATVYTLEIGGAGRRLIVSLDNEGVVSEQVTGVAGRSCVDLTMMFEGLSAQSVDREWTVEYSEVVEDQVIQVLNLR